MEQKMSLPDQPVVSKTPSPPWNNTTKLIVGFTLVAIVAGLVISFKVIIGPLLMAFILAYLVHPLALLLKKRAHFSWRLAVSVIYLFIVLILIGLLTWGGIALVEQIQSLVKFLQTNVSDLPAIIQNFLSTPIHIGPFLIQPSSAELAPIIEQLSRGIQPLLSEGGSLVGSFASGAANTVSWFIFTLLVSYFILAESGGLTSGLIKISIPGYQEDMQRMGHEIQRIWNAFLRGQILIILLTIFVYSSLLAALGVHYFYGLAIIAGMARFVPYIGPAVAWIIFALVTYFQGGNFLMLVPIVFTIMVVGIALITDFILDNLVNTPLMADVLRVHPAAVLVMAIIGASLLGIVGVLLAAPVTATLKLLLTYTSRKLANQDPWDGFGVSSASSQRYSLHNLRKWLEQLRVKLNRLIHK